MADFPRSFLEFQRRFSDDAACAEYLVSARWPDGFRCPACAKAKAWRLASRARLTFVCAACAKEISVTAGTIMHRSHLPLSIWFWAAYLMATHSNGMSALQLQSQLSIGSYKTAWLLAMKLRRAMVAPGRSPLGGLVEVDETTIPFRTKDDPPAGGQGRSHIGKLLVVGAVEIKSGKKARLMLGRVRFATITDYRADTIHTFMKDNIEPGSVAKTDGLASYLGAPDMTHEPHVVGTMAAHIILPAIHLVFSNLKTWALGVYHGVRRKHLAAYLDEFTFRFNRRKSRHAAFATLLSIATAIEPVTYKMLIAQGATG
jgi:transposase-like protein